MEHKQAAILADFGSTFTKIAILDITEEAFICSVKAPTTASTDLRDGFAEALANINLELVDLEKFQFRLACSSAKGGLRMITVGLVPSLSEKAARMAALGAGAKVIGSFSYELTPEDVSKIEALQPDLILLAGGTDGGNKHATILNAEALSGADIEVSIVVACNRAIADEVVSKLEVKGKRAIKVSNVIPQLGRLEVDDAQKIIQELFLREIVRAKGLFQVGELLGGILMPTPMAALRAFSLLADGTSHEPGIGELVGIDLGGATTDVHSIAEGKPSSENVYQKGLPEPYIKRTVEGDLGLRISVQNILEASDIQSLADESQTSMSKIQWKVDEWSNHSSRLADTEEERRIEDSLAKSAIRIAMRRHAGLIYTEFTPNGQVMIQDGKDLTPVSYMIGSGGIFAHHEDPACLLSAALFDLSDPLSLRPKAPTYLIDQKQIIPACGLLSTKYPDMAIRLLKSNLRKL